MILNAKKQSDEADESLTPETIRFSKTLRSLLCKYIECISNYIKGKQRRISNKLNKNLSVNEQQQILDARWSYN